MSVDRDEARTMRFAVDAWSPDYGGGVELDLVQSDAPTTADVEVPLAHWAPIDVGPVDGREGAYLFVDGVQRVDARAWVTDLAGRVHPGVCVSYASGVMRCDGRARVEGEVVERRFLCAAADATDIVVPHGPPFVHALVAGDAPEALTLALHQRRGELEAAVSRSAAVGPDDVVIVDGRLQPAHGEGPVGSIKTQHSAYGPPEILATAGRLAVGQRTPLFVVGDRFSRLSWYVRLPCAITYPLAGLVRCEASSDLGRADAIRVADRVTRALGRFASEPHKDPRAPQNLYPIASLERHLRHRLGDAALAYRSLRAAAGGA
jgi:hypothetical protein